MQAWAADAAMALAEEGFEPIDSVVHVGSEAGEFLGAWMRWAGRARRTDTEQAARFELADVVIAAYVVAEQNGWDLEQDVAEKWHIIRERGYREAGSARTEPKPGPSAE